MECSVLTPYYKEEVLYSEEELNKENEDGISILFYLQKIYPGNIIEVMIPCSQVVIISIKSNCFARSLFPVPI